MGTDVNAVLCAQQVPSQRAPGQHRLALDCESLTSPPSSFQKSTWFQSHQIEMPGLGVLQPITADSRNPDVAIDH